MSIDVSYRNGRLNVYAFVGIDANLEVEAYPDPKNTTSFVALALRQGGECINVYVHQPELDALIDQLVAARATFVTKEAQQEMAA